MLSSARIKADGTAGLTGLFGSFPEQTVDFVNGESDWVEFTMSSAIPSQVAIHPAEYLTWAVMAVDGVRIDQETITSTGPHKVYVLLDEPRSPWDNAANCSNNAWTNALEFACSCANGATTADEVATAITHAIYESGKFQYEVGSGEQRYSSGNTVYLSSCLDRLSGKWGRGPYVNCTDCASFVVSFANSLGCALYSSKMYSPDFNVFYTNPYIAIGSQNWSPPSWGWFFGYHEVAWSGGCGDSDLVYDACLRYNGASTPTNLPRVATLPVGVVFSDSSPDAPYVYRERLTPATTNGYYRCCAFPNTKTRRSVR